MPNGVDLSAALPTARSGKDGPLELLFVGRAEERKGLPVLLRAFEALRSAGVPARLTVAGATREEVDPLLLDAEGVRVAGRVTDDEKWRLLGEADILCAPSLGGESFGMVLTESFASSTPVVASDIAGYREVVRDGVDGLLVPAGEPAALGEALRSLALDPARRAEMSAAARERAERFAWPRVTDEVLETYGDAIEMPARAGAAARLGLVPADPGPPAPPRRLPSIEPGIPQSRTRTAVQVARRVGIGGGGRGRHGPGRARARPPWDPVDRARDRRSNARMGAGGLRADVRLDAAARRGLARDPARRPSGFPRRRVSSGISAIWVKILCGPGHRSASAGLLG